MNKYITKYPRSWARAEEDDQPTDRPTSAQPSVTAAVCKRGKLYKNMRGLKIHQAKMGCLSPSSVQSTGQPGETVERLEPVSAKGTKEVKADGLMHHREQHKEGAGISSSILSTVMRSRSKQSISQQHTPGRISHLT